MEKKLVLTSLRMKRAGQQMKELTHSGSAVERMLRGDQCCSRGRSRLLIFWLHEHPLFAIIQQAKGKKSLMFPSL